MRRTMQGRFVGAPIIPTTTVAPGVWGPNDAAYYRQSSGNNLHWPTQPNDPSFASVSLLCHFNEWSPPASATDAMVNKGSGPGILLVSGATITAQQAKFGQLSLDINGRITAGAATATSNAVFNYGAGDFTLEAWVYLLANSSGFIWDQRPGVNGIYPGIAVNSGNLSFSVNGSNIITGTGAPLTNNAWHHVAIAKASGSSRLFVDGTQTGSTLTDSNTYLVSPVTLGNSGFSNVPILGYIQEARATKGVGRYVANFTAPTAPFADY